MSASAVIDGELTLTQMPQWLTQADRLAGSAQIDLAAITRADSAGLAYLLELKRRAQAQGAPLSLIGAPPQLRQIASFFELDTILGL